LIRFTEAKGRLPNPGVYVIFGVPAAGPARSLSWTTVGYALLGLTVIRTLQVAIPSSNLPQPVAR
jgi:hypothetical protein